MDAIRKFFANKDGDIIIFQVPNAPIIIWFIFLLLSKLLPSRWGLWTGYISSTALLTWAVLEIGWGASYFRRTLGLVVVILLIASRL